LVLGLGPHERTDTSIRIVWPRLLNGSVDLTDASVRRLKHGVPDHLGPLLWLRQDVPTRACHGHRPLREFARIRRGVATGANDFFFLTDSQVNRLPDNSAVRALVRLSHLDGEVLDLATHDEIGHLGYPRWLLSLSSQVNDATLVELIRDAEERGLHRRHITSQRHPWYSVERVVPPDILLASMAKHRFRVARNDARVTPSNSIYGIYVSDARVSIPRLTTWLHSDAGQVQLRAVARHYAGGLYKLEPRDVLKMTIPFDAIERSEPRRPSMPMSDRQVGETLFALSNDVPD
jgi:hypothetical protein